MDLSRRALCAYDGRMRTICAYALMCFIWGTTWLAIKIGLHGFGPLTGVGLRFVLAGAVLYAIAAARGELRPARAMPWGLILTLALFTIVLDYVPIYVAETHIDSGLVAVLFATLPFFTFAFSRVMLGERAGARAIAGAVVAFAGVAYISLSGSLHASPVFAVLVLVAAATASYANVYAKRYGAVPPLQSLPPAMLLAGSCVLIAGLLVEPFAWHHAFAAPAIGALLYLVVAGTCVTFFLLLWLLARLPASIVGMATFVFPVIALFAGALFGSERIGMREFEGAALVFAGMAIALVPIAARRSAAAESSAA
jgi:drug/metabolite transporter (DMT)-like permease